MDDCITVSACGPPLLADPLTNKGTAFPGLWAGHVRRVTDAWLPRYRRFRYEPSQRRP